MRLINRLRCSLKALKLLYRLSGLLNLFSPRFDREKNSAARARSALPAGELNGQRLAPLAALPYGAWRMGENGCEVIAVYNVLLTLGRPAPLAELADALERRGLLLNGYGGTHLAAVAAELRRRGLRVRAYSGAAAGNTPPEGYRCAVLSYWTGKTLRRSDGSWNTLHTVAVRPTREGVEILNAWGDRNTPARADSISGFLREHDYLPVGLFVPEAEAPLPG